MVTVSKRGIVADILLPDELLTTHYETNQNDVHVQHGAKTAPFAGYHMPAEVSDASTVASHQHVRQTSAAPRRPVSLEWLTPSSLSTLVPYTSTLSVLLNEEGGIIDDTMITKYASDAFYVVTNAARCAEGLAWFKARLAEWNTSERSKGGPGLLALQGPAAADHLQALTPYDLRALTLGRSAFVPLDGINVHVARGRYTDEDGFEVSPSPIYIPPAHAAFLASALLGSPERLAGLGARDSLHLEAGMCLYGNDLDESTTPVEAGVIGKDRPLVGVVTSGIPLAPTAGKNISMV
ncbi:hypothetical protein EDB87DRAFT_1676642 [Lactarius vividus]|nr:hypothetical protein EDB87DRAFT_1676642 [Lactarius vividus]